MSLNKVIALSFLYVLVYAISILANWTPIALMLMCLSPLVIIWVTIRTLKDPYKSKHTFQEKFYQDYDYRRNQ